MLKKKKEEKSKPKGAEEGVSKELQLHEMPLEKMDFEIVKKILSDHITEEFIADEKTNISKSAEDDRFLVLEVNSLEEGLKKASQLLEIPVKELRYGKIESTLKNIDGKIIEIQKIEFRQKQIAGLTEVKAADDKLSAYFKHIYPKTQSGQEVDYQYLLNILFKVSFSIHPFKIFMIYFFFRFFRKYSKMNKSFH